MAKVVSYVRLCRETADLTQLALSRLADVTPAAVSQIESGKRVPSVGTALRLAKALGVKVDDLFELEKEG